MQFLIAIIDCNNFTKWILLFFLILWCNFRAELAYVDCNYRLCFYVTVLLILPNLNFRKFKTNNTQEICQEILPIEKNIPSLITVENPKFLPIFAIFCKKYNIFFK